MPIVVKTNGRTDLVDFFQLGEKLGYKLAHAPFLAFVVTGDEVEVRILDNAEKVAVLPADTPVMAQWLGRWRSDFFRMTAGDVKAALEARANATG